MTREVYVLEEYNKDEGWYPVITSVLRESIENAHRSWPDTKSNPKRITVYIPKETP